LHTYVLDWIENTEGPTFNNNKLLKNFQNEFESWNAITFNDFNKKVQKALKKHVVSRGIYISNANTRPPIPVQLADLLDLEKCPKWPADELAKVAKGPVFGTEGPAFATTQALKPGSRFITPIPTAATSRLSSRLAIPVPTALVTLAQVSTARIANPAILTANAKNPSFRNFNSRTHNRNTSSSRPNISPVSSNIIASRIIIRRKTISTTFSRSFWHHHFFRRKLP
jgi:hypothetical protein